MEKINFVAMGLLLVYALAYMLLFKKFVDFLRKKSCPNQKTLAVTVSVIHVLFWWGMGCYFDEYMSYMIPPSLPILICSFQVAYGKVKP